MPSSDVGKEGDGKSLRAANDKRNWKVTSVPGAQKILSTAAEQIAAGALNVFGAGEPHGKTPTAQDTLNAVNASQLGAGRLPDHFKSPTALGLLKVLSQKQEGSPSFGVKPEKAQELSLGQRSYDTTTSQPFSPYSTESPNDIQSMPGSSDAKPHSNEERVIERIKQINNLLNQLPTELPTLCDLPRKEWWRLFIDHRHHEDANQRADPGEFYDTDESPGYYQSMMELFDRKLATATKQKSEQRRISYEDYTELHNLATKYAPSDEREAMHGSNGIDRPWGPAVFWHEKFPEDGPEREEAFATFGEISREFIDGLPLFQYSSHTGLYPQMPTKLQAKLQGQGIMVGTLTLIPEFPNLDREMKKVALERKKEMTVWPLYKVSEGPQIIDTILKSYYDGKERPDQTRDERLGEIARVIRNIAIIHQKCDGNGRCTIYGLMNIFLAEEGFCPAILPEQQNIFGGRKMI